MQFVDISVFNPTSIDWNAYKNWSRQIDGISRVAMRSSYGSAYTDAHFATFRQAALAANIDVLIYYHYAYPQFNTGESEANWQRHVVGDIRPQDILALDMEENVVQATGQWAFSFLQTQENTYAKKPVIYSYPYFIQAHLQYEPLTRYDLWYADWTFDANSRPSAPRPFTSYAALQYSDKATNIPGIQGSVDADIFIGGAPVGVPQGWSDDGTTLVAPNNHKVVMGFRQYILSHVWNADNVPLEEEYGASPAQLHRPDLGAGTRQCFRDSLMWYTAALGVILEASVGLEVQAAYAEANQTALVTDMRTIAALSAKYIG